MAQTEVKQPGHWSQMNEAGAAFGLNFMFQVHRFLGRWPFAMIGMPVLAWFIWRYPRVRKASKEFLERANVVRQAQGMKPVAVSVWKHVRAFSECIVDQLLGWNGAFTIKDIEFGERVEVEERVKTKKGFIVIGCHLGNLELCRVLSHLRPELQVHVLTHTRHAQDFNRLRKRLNPDSQVNLYQVSALDAGFASRMIKWIERGDVISITGDRTSTSQGQRNSMVDFLGHKAPMPQGPHIVSALLACPVFGVYCLKGPHGYRIMMPKLFDKVQLPRGRRQEALQEYVQQYAMQLETYAVQEPYQWFNFYPFWNNAHE